MFRYAIAGLLVIGMTGVAFADYKPNHSGDDVTNDGSRVSPSLRYAVAKMGDRTLLKPNEQAEVDDRANKTSSMAQRSEHESEDVPAFRITSRMNPNNDAPHSQNNTQSSLRNSANPAPQYNAKDKLSPKAIETNQRFSENSRGEPDARALIIEAQKLLNTLGYDAGPPDGVAGSRTRAAIRSYQRRQGISETGEVTAKLVADLNESIARLNGKNRTKTAFGAELWGGTRIGMSVSEVQKIHPNAVEYTGTDVEVISGEKHLLEIPSIEIQNTKYEVSFYFLNGNLTSVGLSPVETASFSTQLIYFNRALKLMLAKYGKETNHISQNGDSREETYQWIRNGTEIELSLIDFSGLFGLYTISYKALDKQEVDKL